MSGYYANPVRTRPVYIYNIKKKFKTPYPRYKYTLNSVTPSLTHCLSFFISQLNSFTHTLHLSALSLTRPQVVKPSSSTLSSFSVLSSSISHSPEPFHPPHPAPTESLPVSHPLTASLSRPPHGFTQRPPSGPRLALLSRPAFTTFSIIFFSGFSSSM